MPVIFVPGIKTYDIVFLWRKEIVLLRAGESLFRVNGRLPIQGLTKRMVCMLSIVT